VGPEGEAFFIQGNQATLAINDRPPAAKGRDRLGLNRSGPVQQFVALDHLNPGQPQR
jgi:hypothetical protein